MGLELRNGPAFRNSSSVGLTSAGIEQGENSSHKLRKTRVPAYHNNSDDGTDQCQNEDPASCQCPIVLSFFLRDLVHGSGWRRSAVALVTILYALGPMSLFEEKDGRNSSSIQAHIIHTYPPAGKTGYQHK